MTVGWLDPSSLSCHVMSTDNSYSSSDMSHFIKNKVPDNGEGHGRNIGKGIKVQ